jgi:hypothetical protein
LLTVQPLLLRFPHPPVSRRKRGKLSSINADQGIDKVWSNVKAIIDKDSRQTLQ